MDTKFVSAITLSKILADANRKGSSGTKKESGAKSQTHLEEMNGARLQQRIEKLKEIASAPKMPRINLKIKNGNSAFYDKVLEVTPLGLEGGLRQAADGYVFLGTLKHSMPDERGRFEVINDFILPPF